LSLPGPQIAWPGNLATWQPGNLTHWLRTVITAWSSNCRQLLQEAAMFQPKQNMLAQRVVIRAQGKLQCAEAPKSSKVSSLMVNFGWLGLSAPQPTEVDRKAGQIAKPHIIVDQHVSKLSEKSAVGVCLTLRVGRSCDCQKDWEESKGGVCPFSSLSYSTQTLHQSWSKVENLLAIITNFTFSILTNFTSYKKVDHFPIITIDKTFGPFIEEMWLCTFCVVLRISNFCLSIYCCCTIIVYFRPAFVWKDGRARHDS